MQTNKRIGRNLKIGMIFPGQGAQFVGMGEELFNEERVVQEHFEDATRALSTNFQKLCFASSDKELLETIITQTAIFLVSSSIYRLLQEKYGIIPDLVAGHSLGEYTAVHAAGGMNFFDTLYLLNKRGQFMKAAIESQNGGMLAAMNIDQDKLLQICNNYDQPPGFERVAEMAVFNSPTQTVISGTMTELEEIAKDIHILGGKSKIIPANGAFHSRLLRESENNYAVYLFKVDFNQLEIPLINNIMAQKIQTPEEIKLSLVRQTSSHLYWWKSMDYFKEMDLIIEVGPNNKFTKILQREWGDKKIISINRQKDIENLLKTINELEVKKII